MALCPWTEVCEGAAPCGAVGIVCTSTALWETHVILIVRVIEVTHWFNGWFKVGLEVTRHKDRGDGWLELRVKGEVVEFRIAVPVGKGSGLVKVQVEIVWIGNGLGTVHVGKSFVGVCFVGKKECSNVGIGADGLIHIDLIKSVGAIQIQRILG